MKEVKKHVDNSKLCEDKIELVKSLNEKGLSTGIANKIIDEAVPTLEIASSEKVFGGSNNSMIILGRDRPSHPLSGEGGKGSTQSGRIDLIAGLGAAYLHKDGKRLPPCKETVLSPNFAIDAARIYISQKTHLDKHMGLASVDGEIGEGFSGIGMKADTMRFHARGDIKIVTGKGKFQGLGSDGERYSTGGRNQTDGKICFIAGNNTGQEKRSPIDLLRPFGRLFADSRNKLQPLIKGENLIECLDDMIEAMLWLSKNQSRTQQQIAQLSRTMATHIHIATVPGGPTTPSPDALIKAPLQIVQDIRNRIEKVGLDKNLGLIKVNYLNSLGSDYIASKHVFTT